MLKFASSLKKLTVILAGLLVMFGCSMPKPWPASPLYETPVNDPGWTPPADKAAAMEAIEGRYAHYDVVAYDAETPTGPLATFVISYGFTEFAIEAGELVEYDCFCHAEHKANQPIETIVPDEFTQAILPRSTVVDVSQDNGEWKIWRPATPTLIGIGGDPSQPLTMDPNSPLISDDDGDGKPGVTIFMKLYGLLNAELYLARREIFQNDLTLYSDGSLRGSVVDDSEQLVVGATLSILNTPNNPPQLDDPGLSPIILIPISNDIDTCEELMANRDLLFPPEPEF